MFGELSVKRLQKVQKHFTAGEIANLVEEYQDGKTLCELAKRYGCHRETVSRILKRNGVQVRGRGVKPPKC